MPLDGHLYLVNQGWRGKGTGLREGAVTKPLAIPQKKNLAGLGKDRDEAFPFWDHLFSAVAKTIQVKCLSDDEDITDPDATSSRTSPERTLTGILSNRRPIAGVSALADISTTTHVSQLGVIAVAKRDAAKQNLYSRFFRGPTLGPEVILDKEPESPPLGNTPHSADDTDGLDQTPQTTKSSGTSQKKRKSRERNEDAEVRREKKKSRKGKRGEIIGSVKVEHEGTKLAAGGSSSEKRMKGTEQTSSEDLGPTCSSTYEDSTLHRKKLKKQKSETKAVSREVIARGDDSSVANKSTSVVDTGTISDDGHIERKKKKRRKKQQT